MKSKFNSRKPKFSLNEIINRRTLIIGEVGSGKTLLTANIVKLLIEKCFKKEITIIDLAPNKNKIGVPLNQYLKNISSYNIRYLIPRRIYAPRLTASSPHELKSFLYLNYIEAKKLFNIYSSNPTKILIINDLTIFLHYGTVDELLNIIKTSKTFIGNAYYGYSIKDRFNTGLDEVERKKVKSLIDHMDSVVSL